MPAIRPQTLNEDPGFCAGILLAAVTLPKNSRPRAGIRRLQAKTRAAVRSAITPAPACRAPHSRPGEGTDRHFRQQRRFNVVRPPLPFGVAQQCMQSAKKRRLAPPFYYLAHKGALHADRYQEVGDPDTSADYASYHRGNIFVV